jgi:hypothetical protein
MKWRVIVELIESDGTVRSHEVSAGGSNKAECSAATVGLTLAGGKLTLAGLQEHLVQAQTEEYWRDRRRCSHCGSQRPLKDVRTWRLASLFGTVDVRAPRFLPCRCAITRRHILDPVAEIMPDRCTPEYERVIAKMGSLLPYGRARTLLSDFLPLADVPAVETTRRRTMRVGARLEKQAVASQPPAPAAEARTIALSIDGGHVRSVRGYQVRSFEVMLAQISNGDGKQIVFSSMPAETIERIRWRLWHGQVGRNLDLVRETMATLGATAETAAPATAAALKVARLLGELETYVCGQSDIIIDYATAGRSKEPISTAITESTVQWLLHRRMNAQQHMRWMPRGTHLTLKVRCAVVNGTLEHDLALAEGRACRPFRRAA